MVTNCIYVYRYFVFTECDSSCTSGGGLMGCTTSSSTSCCNFYDHSVCVQTCPANHVFDDITFECGCPVGFTGDDCQIRK